MKSWIRRIGVLLVSAIIVFVVGGMVLPTKYSLSRAIEIQAKPEAIHAYVGDLKKWDVWAPWKEEDPEIVTTYGETFASNNAVLWAAELTTAGRKLMLKSVSVPTNVHFTSPWRRENQWTTQLRAEESYCV